MNTDYQAFKLVEQGDKKLHPGCWESLCSSKEQRFEEAKHDFERAGNLFKLQQKWFEAGECFERCANLEESLKNDPSSFLQEASHCFSFCDKKSKIKYLKIGSAQNVNKAVMSFEKSGRFSSAGDARKRLAEDFEKENELAMAIVEYKKAFDYYEKERNCRSSAQSCLLKAADLMVLSDYENAFEEGKATYEKVGMDYLSIPLMKNSAKELFFKCVALYLAYDDYISGDAFLSKFVNEDPSMYDSREHILLKEIIESFRDKSVMRYRTAVTRYKEACDIDKWKVNVFTKIMQKLEKESNDANDIDDFK